MVAKKEENKKFNKENIPNILFLMFSFLLFSFLVYSNFNLAQKRLRLINRIEELKERLDFLKSEKEMLEATISDAKTDDYWEEVMREQGYVKEGEESVVILSPQERNLPEKEKEGFMEVFINQIRKILNLDYFKGGE